MNPIKYRVYMKGIDRKPSLVIELTEHGKFEYVIKQADTYQELKPAYQYVMSNPEYTLENIHSLVMPAYHAQANVSQAG